MQHNDREQRRRLSNYRPVLDRLEDRTVPSTCSVVGGTLTMRGDLDRDLFVINDNGAGEIDFWCARPEDALAIALGLIPPQEASGIHTIDVSTGFGRDHVIYLQTGSRTDALNLDVRLGWGADVFEGTVAGALFFAVPLNVSVDGGLQGDDLSLDASDVNVLSGAELNLTLKGGDGLGRDDLDVTYGGRLDGLLNCTLVGEGGSDTLRADVVVADHSIGSIRGVLRGRQGADFLFFHLVREDEADPFNIVDAVADGGFGFDTCDTTAPPVRRVSC